MTNGAAAVVLLLSYSPIVAAAVESWLMTTPCRSPNPEIEIVLTPVAVRFL